jgi:phosphoenolpyruvate carboxykinase (ATP)
MVPRLVNTGWSGGRSYGVGKRMKIEYTQRIVDTIHDGSLLEAAYELTPIFNLAVPTKVKRVPTELLTLKTQ